MISAESYSVPKATNSLPTYLEIICDEIDARSLPVRPYEIPLPPLDEVEVVHRSSPTPSLKSITKCPEIVNIVSICPATSATQSNDNCIKGRTISSSSTVSETSVYNPLKSNERPNTTASTDLTKTNCILTVVLPTPKEDCKSNETLLKPQQPSYTLQQMYANTNIESAIRTCDGITSM